MAAMTITSPSNVEVPIYPTWMTTLDGQPPVDYRVHGWQRDAEDVAWGAGYRFLLWNGRVYFLDETEDEHVFGLDTGWQRDDIDYFTANHPDISRINNFAKESW